MFITIPARLLFICGNISPLLYLCIYTIVSLLWANHSCSAIHLLTNVFFFFLNYLLYCGFSCWFTYSLSPCLVVNSTSFSGCLERASAWLLSFFFCHTDWEVSAPFVYRKKASALHVLRCWRELYVFQGKTDSVISLLMSLFLSTFFSFPALRCHPFYQDCLPGASRVHLFFTAWLQGQKHPPYIQTFTHLLRLNLSSPNPAPSLTLITILKWFPYKMQTYKTIKSKLLELQLIQSCARVNCWGWF